MAFIVEIRTQCDRCKYVHSEHGPIQTVALKLALSEGWKKTKGQLVCDGCLGGLGHHDSRRISDTLIDEET